MTPVYALFATPMYELVLIAGCVATATILIAQLLRRRIGAPSALAAILQTLGGAAVCALMLYELVFGGNDGLETTGLPLDLGTTLSVLVSGLNLAFGWTIMQARWGVLRSQSAALESSFRAACTLVLLNAPLIPFEDSATGVIIAAAVTCLGVAAAHMGGAVIRSPRAERRHSSPSLYA
ncbi:MAG TPA: hypothetical protein VFL57_06815 [Bryobacteraceae bacterium]|nr:hypothetical protein [Bryobacteraceae bacterium]